ncbi:hypothetical protein GQ42DRAFT_160339 [Ramicandelaber brevisporus]|nr:hypothetical protein GQ42DRAFT_160339 [Ramicandelaber brevisporus]
MAALTLHASCLHSGGGLTHILKKMKCRLISNKHFEGGGVKKWSFAWISQL